MSIRSFAERPAPLAAIIDSTASLLLCPIAICPSNSDSTASRPLETAYKI